MNDTCTDVAATYAPSPDFATQANGTADLYWEADVDRLGFWAKQAARLSWQTPFTDVLDSSEASSTWPTTAWTATSRRATVIEWRSGGRASRSATAAPSPMRSCCSRC